MGERASKRIALPIVVGPQALPATLQRCDRLSARLTVEACTQRYRRASGACLVRGNERTVAYEVCLGCQVGRANTSAARRAAERVCEA
jgi:hypothetical protein